MLQRISGSVGDLIDEFDIQWRKFAENHNLFVQHQIQQAHYNTAQATIFMINIHVNNNTHHAIAITGDSLDHDVTCSNYVTDDACQHFKSNKSILNLIYHYRDFRIAPSWTFASTAHGKSSVDGIGASIKYRATRRVLSGDRRDAIFTPRELYHFASIDTSLKVFYLDSDAIQSNSRKYNLEAQLNQRRVKGKYKLRTLF